MSDKTCADCVNYQPAGVAYAYRRGADVPYADHPTGECRIGPPQPSPDLTGARWPLVFAEDWCGCFIRKDEEPVLLSFPADKVGPVPAQVLGDVLNSRDLWKPVDPVPATLSFADALRDRDHS